MRLESRTDLRGKLPFGIGEIPFRKERTSPNWLQYPALATRFRDIVVQHKFDVVHAGPIPHVALIPALAGFPHLASMSWGSDLLYHVPNSLLQHALTRYTLRRSRVLVGDCKAVMEEGQRYGISADREVLFPWGVDLKHFSPGKGDLRKKLGWERNFVVMCVRSWEKIYGVDIVLRAFKKASAIDPDLRLLLLADGSQKAKLLQYIQKQGLASRIHIAGRVSQELLPEYYRSADLYVSASHTDGSSVSLLEAFACGLPALVSDIAGNLEWVEPGKTGWLFPDGDVNTLAAEMLRIKDQQKQLSQMKVHCRRTVEKRADWAKNSLLLTKAYEMALAG